MGKPGRLSIPRRLPRRIEMLEKPARFQNMLGYGHSYFVVGVAVNVKYPGQFQSI